MSLDSRRLSGSQKHWKLNWWDLWPLVDGEQRPLQWTSNSLIFSPHPSSPAVLVRTFPSSSSFALPSPTPVANNPAGYASPSVIEVSPSDEYAFAFFDGKGNDGIACIWHREETIDTWKVNLCWNIKPGQGIVFAKWLGEERMWLNTNPPTRAPPLGPSNHFGKTTLLFVNQSHTVQIVHRASPSFPFQLSAASLRHATQVNISDRAVMGEATNGPGGLSVCVKAAIGMGYNESSIIVATSSVLIPPPMASIPEFSNPFNVDGSASLPPTSPSQSLWENFGPEQIIRLCELKITAHGFILGISTRPMPPLFPPATSSSRLANILMIPYLPPTDSLSLPDVSTVENSTTTPIAAPKTLLHLVLAYMEFENDALPRCDLMSFELQRTSHITAGSGKTAVWRHRHLTTRPITSSAVSFILPSRIPGSSLMMAGMLDLEGVVPRQTLNKDNGKARGEVRIGKVVMLKILSLEDDPDWEPSSILTGVEDVDADPPISATVSPGGSLICTSPAMWSGVSKLGIQTHPRHLTYPVAPSISQLTESLLSTLLSDRPAADILHSLQNPALSLASATEVLERALEVLDCEEFSTRDWLSSLLGIMVELFRARSKYISGDSPNETKEKTALEERWHVAMDLCSVKALVGAFEACREEDASYDLEPVWQLISLSTWLVEFVERLLRVCVLWEGRVSVGSSARSSHDKQTGNIKVKMEAMDIDGDILIDDDRSPNVESVPGASANLLHVLHPFALKHLTEAVAHLTAFRGYLDSLQASVLKATIAKDILIDAIDCSGINFKELSLGLAKANKEVQTIDGAELRRCFCTLTPSTSTYEVLSKVCKHVTSEEAVYKSRLFIKPADLVDSISKLGIAATKRHQDRDIVSKSFLGMPGTVRMCARCKGRTETGQTPLPRGKDTGEFGRWAVWEHEWERCICGGLWVRWP